MIKIDENDIDIIDSILRNTFIFFNKFHSFLIFSS
jgi:hypothetical protein